MRTVAGIRFKSPGKIYYFDPAGLNLEKGMHVIVDTAMGEEYGEVVLPKKEVNTSFMTSSIRRGDKITVM